MRSHQIVFTVVTSMDNQHEPAQPRPTATVAINGARMSVLGWGRAILLQLAHPLVAAGVAEHSSFRESRWSPAARLHGTVRAMLAFSFGSAADVDRAAAHINGIHDRVNGRLRTAVGIFPAGHPYTAHDPALLLWVHVTLLDSMPLAYEQLVAPLGDEDVAAYCRESARGAPQLGIDPAAIPTSRAELRAHMDRVMASGVLHVGDEARALARAILRPPFGRLVPPIAHLHRLTTVGWLPPSIRDAYGLPWSDADARALDSWVARLRTISRRAPRAVTHWKAARKFEMRMRNEKG
jgi:uncharacterized protein (DUF2236 family)